MPHADLTAISQLEGRRVDQQARCATLQPCRGTKDEMLGQRAAGLFPLDYYLSFL